MNCSARIRCLLLPLLLATAAPVAAETTAELDDAVARMQFAFYTADTRPLEEMLSVLAGFEVDASLAAAKSYQLAYGNWKLAQLYSEPLDERPRPNAKSNATKAAKACVQHARDWRPRSQARLPQSHQPPEGADKVSRRAPEQALATDACDQPD